MTDSPDTEENRENATSGDVIAPTGTAGAWMRPPPAAAALGISERTLWRHVEAGRYRKRIVDGRAEVFVPGEMSGAPDSVATPQSLAERREPDNSAMLVVAELQRHLTALEASRAADMDRLTRQAEEIGRLQAERDALREQLDAERQARAAAERRRWWWPF